MMSPRRMILAEGSFIASSPPCCHGGWYDLEQRSAQRTPESARQANGAEYVPDNLTPPRQSPCRLLSPVRYSSLTLLLQGDAQLACPRCLPTSAWLPGHRATSMVAEHPFTTNRLSSRPAMQVRGKATRPPGPFWATTRSYTESCDPIFPFRTSRISCAATSSNAAISAPRIEVCFEPPVR